MGMQSEAFLVGKNQIACCQSFNNRVLKERAEKFEYGAKAFVIGLKTIKKVYSMHRAEDGELRDNVCTFDFTRNVNQFLKGIAHHLFHDSHLIIELVPVHKIPHYFFPEYDNKRPTKKFIVEHQEQNEINHKLWKSKNCLATMEDEEKAKENDNTASPLTQSQAAGADENHNRSQSSSLSQTPMFDKNDVLMNDGDMAMEEMPGLALPQSVVNTNGDEKKASNFSVNGVDHDVPNPEEEGKVDQDPEPKVSSPTKRKHVDEEDENHKADEIHQETTNSPPTKKRKLMESTETNGNGDNHHHDSNGSSTQYTVIGIVGTNVRVEEIPAPQETTNNVPPPTSKAVESKPADRKSVV